MCTFWFAVKFPFNVQKRLYCEKRLLLPYPSFNCWIVAFTNPPTWFITTVCSLYGVQYTGDFHIWKGQCHKTFDPFFRKNLGNMQTFLFSWRYSRNCVSALSTTMPRWQCLCGHWWWILKASHWLYRNNHRCTIWKLVTSIYCGSKLLQIRFFFTLTGADTICFINSQNDFVYL